MGVWLIVLAGMMYGMTVLGGVTRLTHAGLSIPEWKPVKGIVPPLSQEAWQRAFDAYQQFPEFRELRSDMKLEEFQRIYWIEYTHRLLGRLIAVVFALPFLWFWIKGRLTRRRALALGAIFMAGGLQGAIGWFMVKSGLSDNPRVSPYRLTLHLSVAVLLYLATLDMARRVFIPLRPPVTPLPRWPARLILGLIYLQLLSGGLVAGHHAGVAFPALISGAVAGAWLPELGPRNLFDNVLTLLLFHVSLAIVIAMASLAWGLQVLRLKAGNWSLKLFWLVLVLQLALGWITAWNYSESPPVVFASLHQAVGLLLITAAFLMVRFPGPTTQRVVPNALVT